MEKWPVTYIGIHSFFYSMKQLKEDNSQGNGGKRIFVVKENTSRTRRVRIAWPVTDINSFIYIFFS